MQKSYKKHSGEEREHKESAPVYVPNKGLIMLKSTVVGLFIVLVVLMFTFIIVKNKHQKTAKKVTNNCAISNVVTINQKIEKLDVQNNIITVLGELDKKTGKQEIIRLDANCGQVINRTIFQVNKAQ